MTNAKMKEIEQLEKDLCNMISSDMSIDDKIKVLSNSYWRAHNAGYCDHVAGIRMCGIENSVTIQHDQDCKYKWEVSRLLELLTEYKEFGEPWLKASELFDRDNKAGYEAWLELSERGYARATHSVAWCKRFGYGTEKDAAKAEELYRKAIEGGNDNSYSGLITLLQDEGRNDEALAIALDGAKKDSSACYLQLLFICENGIIWGGNPRVLAFLAARTYELNIEAGYMLGIYYMNESYLPKVYTYAKYCIENSSMTKEDLEEAGMEFPDFWDEIEPIKPCYPDFGLTLDTCEEAVNPIPLLDKAKELIFAEKPDYESAKPYALAAAEAGYSEAMYYAYLINVENWQDLLVKGADEYGNLECIEELAMLFVYNATFKIGNPYLNEAVRYWNKRKKLHGHVPMSEKTAEEYRLYQEKLDILFGRTPKKSDPDANAILLRTDGSYEKIKVDFSSLEGLYAPLACERINTISTQKLKDISEKLGFTVVMYCDERGMQKHLQENTVAANLSGYDVIWGDTIICGFKKDYAPLYKDELNDICELLETE